jgi:hypothetical protein
MTPSQPALRLPPKRSQSGSVAAGDVPLMSVTSMVRLVVLRCVDGPTTGSISSLTTWFSSRRHIQ